MKIEQVMSRDVACVRPGDSVQKAARLMKERHVGALPVTCRNQVVGMVTDRDIVLRCVASGIDAKKGRVGDIMTKNAKTVSSKEEISIAAYRMSGEQIRRLPVVDEGKLQGMISLSDLARQYHDVELSKALCDISRWDEPQADT